MRERITDFIRTQAYRPLTAPELAEALQIPDDQVEVFAATLAAMEADGVIVQTRRRRYGAPERMNLVVGTLSANPRGFAFVVTDAPDQPDVYVGRENLNGAMHGDRVMVRLAPTRDGARPEGEVIRILSRGCEKLVGTFDGTRTAGFVTPDDRRITMDILVPKGRGAGAHPGDKVVVRITRYPDTRRGAEGQVIERLGKADDPGVDILAIIRRHQLPEAFPQKVLKEAEALPDVIPAEELDRRRDLRGLDIITIDGEDAKDLDDAVHLQRSGDGWHLMVHIADVSYYVKEGQALDREALRRATSVYLADRVVPMLPPKLSNQVCSLNADEDKLTLTCDMELDADGRVARYDIYPSVIRSVARMTYTGVHGILQGDADLRRKYSQLVPMLENMQELMQVLRRRRMERGALDFDLPEAKLVLGEAGETLDVRLHERTAANQIVEEFMLAANETVARHCFQKKLPVIYRVHEDPDPEKMAALAEFLALFGYTRLHAANAVKKITPKVLQDVTTWATGKDEANLINSVLLRSLKQARYHPGNLGHFGLAATHYTHFTSPIRRYPDLVVHRVLREALAIGGRLSAKRRARLEVFAAEAAVQSSERERTAVEAERDTYDLKKAQYMADKVGETFDAVISGVTAFGFFVALANTVEGLIHVSSLADDYYHFQEKAYALVGERTRRIFRLGDRVRVRVVRVDVHNRQIDFELAPVAGAAAAPAVGAAREPERRPAPAAAGQRREPASREGRHERGRPPQRGQEEAEAPPPSRRPERVAKAEATRLDMWGLPVTTPARRHDDDDDGTGPVMFAMTTARSGDRSGHRPRRTVGSGAGARSGNGAAPGATAGTVSSAGNAGTATGQTGGGAGARRRGRPRSGRGRRTDNPAE